MKKTDALADQTCEPCRGGVPPLKGAALAEWRLRLDNAWTVVDEHHLERTFTFANFKDALAFTNRIGAIAEEQHHHPEIHLGWGRVKVLIWTHKIDGLTGSDFILAAKMSSAS